MNDTNKVALATAIAAGYALGRTRKAKLALTVGTYLAGRRFKLSPQELVTEGVSRLRETPQFNAISDQVRGDLLTAGRSALTAAADRRFDSLADTLRERTSLLSSPRSEEDEEDDDTEYEEWEDEPEDEYAEEEDDDFGEADEDEAEPGPEPAPRRRSPAAKKSPPAKKSVPSKKSPPAKKSVARKPGEDRPAKKAAKKPSPEKLSGKKAPGRKATDERPAKKTAKKAPAKESAAKKPPAKSARRPGREG
ncbi:hypothetical protein ACF1GX_00540 [Streptomyces albidoflavus]|uniref:hypothetical protein n=1 Tax=Streptomyces albidoflavus TaxID=1886 RepID=UPI00344FF4BE